MSEQIDGQESLFELHGTTPERTPEELREFTTEIGLVAATRKQEDDKELSEAFADLGYRRRETLAANPPRLANPKRTKTGPSFDPARDPHYFGPYKATTPEEVAEQQAVLDGPGHKAARAALAITQMNIASREAAGDVTTQLAITRAQLDKQFRP